MGTWKYGRKPTPDEIDEAMNEAAEAEAFGRSRWPGMSYEQGFKAAIEWLRGETDYHPLEEE